MKEIEITNYNEIPDNFTGVVKDNIGRVWLKNGKIHRCSEPAGIFFNKQRQIWYQYGKKHRLNGPAILETVGCNLNMKYWINGEKYSKEEFDEKTKLIQQQLSKRQTDYKHLTDEQWYEHLNTLVIE